MAIEVMKKGVPPMDKKYETECNQCNSILRFLRSDVDRDNSPRNESYYRFKCPVCQKELYIDTVSAKEVR